MESGNSYCHAVSELEDNHIHKMYHDHHYGFPIKNDNELFERLVLEINQAGLSWTTILRKQEYFRKAYDGFEIDKVAQYQEMDIARLLSDSGIIRNRLKINAAIYNAKVLQGIQKEYGSFYQWLEHHHPLTKEEWTTLFKKTFHFTGGEIVNEFLMSTGYLPGSHVFDCPIYQKTIQAGAAWSRE